MSVKALIQCDSCKHLTMCNIHCIETMNSDTIKIYFCDECNKERVEESEPEIDW